MLWQCAYANLFSSKSIGRISVPKTKAAIASSRGRTRNVMAQPIDAAPGGRRAVYLRCKNAYSALVLIPVVLGLAYLGGFLLGRTCRCLRRNDSLGMGADLRSATQPGRCAPGGAWRSRCRA